jgi:Ca2+-binding RTX toxin-like protein
MTMLRVSLLALLVVAASAAVVLTTSNTVPATYVGRQQAAITANSLKPAFCASISLTTVVAGTTGTVGNDLLLGPNGGATLDGNGGVDCIVGGGGNDTINGNGNGAGANDFCIGGPGTDTFKKCKNTQQ